MSEKRLKQGSHLDPGDPTVEIPDPLNWSQGRREAFSSPAMETFRSVLRLEGHGDIRSAIVDDLATYHHLSIEDTVRRAVNWESWSVEEWQTERRDTEQGLVRFYQETQSWAFDLLWYAYLQAEGFHYPVSVAIAVCLGMDGGASGLTHLDFGSGAGVTAQFFGALGCESTMADISTSLLAFSRFRLERRGIAGTKFIDLNQEPLPTAAFDVITAIDTLAHVPDLKSAAANLHRALKPGGMLFANFDVRPPSAENAWHLYDDDLPLRWILHRTGFEQVTSLDGFSIQYRRVPPRGLAHLIRGLRDLVLLRSPLRRAYRWAAHHLRHA
ncbi:MAG TPA: class I SAM-dependent methyltransferase [Candidatus Dormibacteraeota bacterium]|jgi:2-polyprenyl-3-methyl-5-hydroxy-6-metoxy-1,4-benzoquinol methylase|nr:class I SAM-dependent methyltransferase [Candidatus Dormibacteraeota bacterium]